MPVVKYMSSLISISTVGVTSLALARWTGFGETTTDQRYMIWYCRDDPINQYGVALIVQKDVVGSIISCITISSRLVRISVRPHITVIQVYAPTSDHDHEEAEQFYEQLDNIIAKIPKKDTLVVQGDWNV